MTFDNIALNASPCFLSGMGSTIVYTPSGGTAVSLVALVDDEVTFGDMDALKRMVEVREMDISFTPASGDAVVIGSVSYTVHNGPGARIDHDGVWWKIPVIRDERGGFRGRKR